jgi:ectoine hydroxylase-related dioxygenase (phytanoyl-CoA dioxygenase family)
MSPTECERRRLDEDGYLVLGDFMGEALLAALRRRVEELFAAEGERAGAEFKQEPGCRRLANLVDKGEIFEEVLAHPALLPYIRHVLGPEVKLSSLNARSVNPLWPGVQPLHADMAAVPDARGFWVCNTVWLLDDFTAENGAIRLIPGSHRWGRLPQEVLPDPAASHPGEVLVTGRAGSVVVMNAHLWHGGTANRTATPRTAVHAFYCRRDKPQQQYQKALLRPEVQHRLAAPLRWLLALDDPHNDRVSAAVAVRSGFLK